MPDSEAYLEQPLGGKRRNMGACIVFYLCNFPKTVEKPTSFVQYTTKLYFGENIICAYLYNNDLSIRVSTDFNAGFTAVSGILESRALQEQDYRPNYGPFSRTTKGEQMKNYREQGNIPTRNLNPIIPELDLCTQLGVFQTTATTIAENTSISPLLGTGSAPESEKFLVCEIQSKRECNLEAFRATENFLQQGVQPEII